MEKISLKKGQSKTSLNDDSYLSLNMTTKKMLLPSTSIDSILNLKEQYDTERANCNTIRLVCTINPLCTNVLHNNKTEIVINEGSDNPIVSAYNNFVLSGGNLSNLAEYTFLKGDTKPKTYTPLKLIQDTQLSRFDDVTYHCGLDIFNNHTLRNISFKSVTLPKATGDTKENTIEDYSEYTKPDEQEIYFNTIRDLLRNYHGKVTSGYSDILLTDEKFQQQIDQNTRIHLYLNEELDDFRTCVDDNLMERNGWLGFINSPSLPPYNSNDKVVSINKPINNESSCAFIDMYPNRELYYFSPLYNKHRHRIEKNWNYCLTYPSSSTTNVDFINSVDGLNALKIAVYDDETINGKGVESILIYSTCKHGLEKNDIVNIYETVTNDDGTQTNVKRINGVFVNEVVDEYSFYIDKNGNSLSEVTLEKGSWVDLSDEDTLTKEECIQIGEYVYANKEKTKYFPVCNGRVNLSENNMNFSFKKVVGSLECDYYVRIFSRIPNWKFRKEKPTEYEMYKDNKLINTFQQLENDFESHCGQVGFARNIYNDEVSEIVFTDDIDLSNLKDNLGRPVTSIYLTILKNNRGYRDWYNHPTVGGNYNINFKTPLSSMTLNNGDLLKNNDTLEYSHCFGKLSNGFKLSYRSLINKDLKNILRTSTIFENEYNGDESQIFDWAKKCSSGLSYTAISNPQRTVSIKDEIDEDSVSYRYFDTIKNSGNTSGDVSFYGDVVCFSPTEFTETSLEMSSFRFNTAQRDFDFKSAVFKHRLGTAIFHDEIVFDDFDYNTSIDSDGNRNTVENFSAVTKNGFTSKNQEATDENENSMKRKEGYYYQGHYEIPIHTFATDISTQAPKFYTPQRIVYNEDYNYFLIKTMDKTYLELHDKIYLYNTTLSDVDTIIINGVEKKITEDYKYVTLTVEKVIDRRRVYVYAEESERVKMMQKYKISGDSTTHTFYTDSFKMFKPDETIPTYAYLLKDKTFRFIWREVLHNGTDSESDIEQYPFTNNALYVNKFINFYLKRQDPNNYLKDYSWDGYSLQSNEYPYDSDVKEISISDENNYYEEDDIEC